VRMPGSELLAAAPSCRGLTLRAEGGSVAARCRVGGVQNACGAPRKAKPRMLWAPWQLEGEALVDAKHDATLLALKEQEDALILDVTMRVAARSRSETLF